MTTYTAFDGHHLVATGPIEEVALQVKSRLADPNASVLIFEDHTGQQIDLDLRGTDEDALARLKSHPWFITHHEPDEKRTGPGRPKLGVTSREVSLLPRHWEWLNGQPGGASTTLRKLVEERMKAGMAQDRARKAHDAATKFMWTMGGNLPHFEEASRAFSRREYDRFTACIAEWPADLQAHVRRLADTARQAEKDADHDT